MKLELITFPHPILTKKISSFDFNNPPYDPKELETSMLEFMYKCQGIGLAANQVGIDARVFVMGHADNPSFGKAFFNPLVVQNTEEIVDMEEGCLSFPNMYVKVKRPKAIKAIWQNVLGEWEESEFSGYDCKCFLHELDHLEGITFKDRVSKLKWNLAMKRNKR